MKLIHTEDNRHYRRWVNLIPSLLLPGSSQFLSGRRMAGCLWFVAYLMLITALLVILVHPGTSYSFLSMGPLPWFKNAFTFFMACDGLRRPIRRLHFKGWLLFLCVALGVLLLPLLTIRAFLVQPFRVPAASMQPTIVGTRNDTVGHRIIGDQILINKLIYHFSEPKRGDVIAFKSKGLKSEMQGTSYVKRIAGLPGETISIDAPYLMVNGSKVTKPTIFQRIAEGQNGFSGFCPATPNPAVSVPLASPSDKITLGSDEYLVLGDNTLNSYDGRYFGPIKRSAIIGKAFYIYAPADRKQKIE